MSLSQHRLRVSYPGGVTVTRNLLDFNITNARLTFRSGGIDEMQLVIAGGAETAAAFSAWSKIELFDPSGVRRFCGTALRPRITMQAGRYFHTVRVVGPWFLLERFFFTQPWLFVDNTDSADPPTSTSDISNVVLNRRENGDDDAPPVSLAQQLNELMQQAEAAGAEVRHDFSAMPEIYLPEMFERSRPVWHLIKTLMTWAPHVTLRWDYAIPGHPILRAVAPSASSSGARRVSPTAGTLRGLSVIPRDDLLFSGVKINWLRTHAVSVDNGAVTIREVIVQQTLAGIGDDGLGAPGLANITIELRGAQVSNGEVSQAPEALPAGDLSASMAFAFIRLWHELKFAVVGKSVDWSWVIGGKVGFVVAAVAAELAEVRAMTVALDVDIAEGSVSVHAGPPGMLAFGNVTSIILPERMRFQHDKKPDDAQGERQLDPEATCDDKCSYGSGGVDGGGE